MIKDKRTIFSLLILFIIAITTYWRWISFNLFTNGDWPYFFPNTFKFFSFNYTWLNLYDMGSVNLTVWRFIVVFAQSIIAGFGYGANVSEKIFIFWPTIFFGNLFSFLLVKRITRSNIAGLIGAIVFNYNTYYLVSSDAFLLYAAAPWVLLSLLLFIKGLEVSKKYLFVISGLTLFIASSYDFRVAYMAVLLLFFYSLYYLFFIQNLKISKVLLKGLARSFVTFFTFGFLNIYWVLPMLKLGSLTSNAALDRSLFGNEFLNINYAITLFHPFWTGTKSAWFIVEPIMVYFWLIPIIAFLGLYLNRKNKNVLFFGIIALLGIFLTKQVGIPFSGVYAWLFAHLPGFNAFREASKFYFLVALGYAVLIGAFVKYFFENLKSVKVYFKYILVVGIALLFLWNIKPILTGEIGGIFVPRQIPNDYLIAKNFILKDADYSRTIWVPSSSTWSIYTVMHPMISIASALPEYTYWTNYVNSLPVDKYPEGKLMTKALNLPLSNNLLDISSVKYVFVPTTDIANDANVFVFYGESRQYYIDQLNKINWLKRINIGTKELVVYENENYKPHLYLTDEKETIKKDVRVQTKDIRYEFVNPTEYKVTLKNINASEYLNFSEAFNPQWRIRVGRFNWLDVITQKNYFLSDKSHFQNDATLNSYLIDPKTVCKVYKVESCKVNKDGSYNIDMTLYFAPQSYLYLGLIISGGTFILILGYLGLVFGRNIYEKNH